MHIHFKVGSPTFSFFPNFSPPRSRSDAPLTTHFWEGEERKKAPMIIFPFPLFFFWALLSEFLPVISGREGREEEEAKVGEKERGKTNSADVSRCPSIPTRLEEEVEEEEEKSPRGA